MNPPKEILRFSVDEDDTYHFLVLEEQTHEIYRNYKEVGQRKLLHLSHEFPNTVYGVSMIAGMDPETAVLIGTAMVQWGKENHT